MVKPCLAYLVRFKSVSRIQLRKLVANVAGTRKSFLAPRRRCDKLRQPECSCSAVDNAKSAPDVSHPSATLARLGLLLLPDCIARRTQTSPLVDRPTDTRGHEGTACVPQHRRLRQIHATGMFPREGKKGRYGGASISRCRSSGARRSDRAASCRCVFSLAFICVAISHCRLAPLVGPMWAVGSSSVPWIIRQDFAAVHFLSTPHIKCSCARGLPYHELSDSRSSLPIRDFEQTLYHSFTASGWRRIEPDTRNHEY